MKRVTKFVECIFIIFHCSIAATKFFIRRREVDCLLEVWERIVKCVGLVVDEISPELH